MTVRVTGFGGSLREGSISRQALDVALKAAAASDAVGVVTELLDVQALSLPMFDPEVSSIPDSVQHLLDAFRRADGMIWSSPVYHGTISGAIKNGLDWLQLLARDKRAYLSDTPIGLIATSAGTRSSPALHTMAAVVQSLRGWTVPFTVGINASRFTLASDGRVRDPDVARQVGTIGDDGGRRRTAIRSVSVNSVSVEGAPPSGQERRSPSLLARREGVRSPIRRLARRPHFR